VGSGKTSSKQLTIPERTFYFENIINIHAIRQFLKKQIGVGSGEGALKKQGQNN